MHYSQRFRATSSYSYDLFPGARKIEMGLSVKELARRKIETFKRWTKPEVYPLVALTAAAVGLAAFVSVRNLTLNPEVRVNKDDRMSGLVQNFKEGKAYHDHPLRRYALNRGHTQVTPDLNRKFYKKHDCEISGR